MPWTDNEALHYTKPHSDIQPGIAKHEHISHLSRFMSVCVYVQVTCRWHLGTIHLLTHIAGIRRSHKYAAARARASTSRSVQKQARRTLEIKRAAGI